MSLAPVILFTYTRIDTLQQTVESLLQNELSTETELFIFSDGPKSITQKDKVSAVRDYLKTITGFKTVTIYESILNKGLGQSIIDGVTKIILEYDKVIVIEDDLITSPNFLIYMNKALDYYNEHNSIFSISGFSFPMTHLGEKDVYFTLRGSSWGWATWKNKWLEIDWEVSSYQKFRSSYSERRKFNKMGSDMSQMLDRQMNGARDSWAIRWCFHQFKTQQYSVFPGLSKIKNIGSTRGATNTIDNAGRFETILDKTTNKDFNFSSDIKLSKKSLTQFTSHYSILTRIKYKILNLLFRN